MTVLPRPVHIVLPERSHVAHLAHDDDWTRAALNSAIEETRARINATPLDWAEHEILACQLVGLSAHRMHQLRGYEARGALAEAEKSVATARRIVETIGAGIGSADVLGRLTVIRAVVQLNASVLFFQTGNAAPGQQFLGYASDTLSSTTPNGYSEQLYATTAAAISALREASANLS